MPILCVKRMTYADKLKVSSLNFAIANFQKLINVGDPEIASYFTRHRNPNTTTTYYNFPNPAEAFDKMNEQ